MTHSNRVNQARIFIHYPQRVNTFINGSLKGVCIPVAINVAISCSDWMFWMSWAFRSTSASPLRDWASCFPMSEDDRSVTLWANSPVATESSWNSPYFQMNTRKIWDWAYQPGALQLIRSPWPVHEAETRGYQGKSFAYQTTSKFCEWKMQNEAQSQAYFVRLVEPWSGDWLSNAGNEATSFIR